MTQIFISYAHADALSFADWLYTRLTKAGFEVWLDRSKLDGGRDWEESIEEVITDCSHLLAILTPGSVESPVCRAEIGYALHLEKNVIPLMLRDVIPPLRLINSQWLFFTDETRHDESLDLLSHVTQEQAAERVAIAAFSVPEKPAGGQKNTTAILTGSDFCSFEPSTIRF
jgi:hypothetical protein